jgi:hypothetical protein
MPVLSHASCQVEDSSVVTPNTPTTISRDRFETVLAVVAAPFLIVGYYAVVTVIKLLGPRHD